ncbi:MAG: dimethyl sulfoxide reductase anchor subunit [Eggerthellaceae bacterium]|nr:dimethyl sulfoxide reductase anchor subunit [Eggerthellaceae bacterium]
MAVQWPLLIFSVLLGASSGILVFLGIGEIKGVFKKVRFPLAVCALALLAVGGCASALHLGHIDRAFYILGNVNSAFSHELFAVGFAAVVALVYAVLSRKDYPGALKVLGILGLIAGIVLPLVAGFTYLMPARPAWDSFTLPLMYLGTGLGLGFVLSAALTCQMGDEDDASFALRLALAGVVCSIVTTLAYVAWIAMAPHQAPSRSIGLLLSGGLALEFWVGVVLLGIVAPAALGVLALRKAGSSPTGGAPAVATAGAEGGSGAGAAVAAGTKTAAGYLWASLACLVVGNVVLRMIMYAVATSVESLIY